MNPGPIKLLISDVDGTLVTRDKVLTPRALAAVKAMREAGIGLAITSARPPRGLSMLVEPLGLTLPLGGFNGGVIVNPDLSVLETHPLDPAAAHDAAEHLLKLGLDLWVYTQDEWFVRDPKAPHVERERWILKFDPIVVSSFTSAQLDHAVKVVGVSDDPELMSKSEAETQALLGPRASATRSEAHFLDVTDPDANKGAVVMALAKRLNLDPAEIATIGDMPNDVLMFKKSGFSMAMGNASAAVQGEAQVVTDTNENDGFAKAVEQHVLGSSKGRVDA